MNELKSSLFSNFSIQITSLSHTGNVLTHYSNNLSVGRQPSIMVRLFINFFYTPFPFNIGVNLVYLLASPLLYQSHTVASLPTVVPSFTIKWATINFEYD